MEYKASVVFNLRLEDNISPKICYGELYSAPQLTATNRLRSCENQGFPNDNHSSHVFQVEGAVPEEGFTLKKAIAHDDLTLPSDMTLTYTVINCNAGTVNPATEDQFVGEFTCNEASCRRCAGTERTFHVKTTAYSDHTPIVPVQDEINKYVNGKGTARVGYVQVVIEAHDNAGVFSSQGVDNKATPVRFLVRVMDTTAPRLTVHDGAANMECGDQLKADSIILDSFGASYNETMSCGNYANTGSCHYGNSADNITTACIRTTNLDEMGNTTRHQQTKNWRMAGVYEIRYTVQDAELNSNMKTREIQVDDTLAPTITLVGSRDPIVYAGTALPTEHGVTVEDKCDEHINQMNSATQLPFSVSITWEKPFNNRKLGSYVKTYTVSDQKGNTASETRTYHVIDNDKPEIRMIPCVNSHSSPAKAVHLAGNWTTGVLTTCTYEATRDDEYKDAGATCADFVDGQLNHRVTVGGDIVDLTIVGKYVIQYACTDLTGNEAVTQERTVIVRDDTSPVITMYGKEHVKIEAGFPYTDAGASATDTLEGLYQNCSNVDTAAKIITGEQNDDTKTAVPVQLDAKCLSTYGNSINEYYEYSSAESCASIFSMAEGANSGTYKILARKTDADLQLIEVVCDMDTDTPGQQATYFHSPDCSSYEGFSLGFHSDVDPVQKAFLERAFDTVQSEFNSTLCKMDEGHGEPAQLTTPYTSVSDECGRFDGNQHRCTKVGTYEIQYHVKDHAGNDAEVTRTVSVLDSLPPVISLRFAAKQKGLRNTNPEMYTIQTSGSALSAADNKDSNPALDAQTNPYLLSSKTLLQAGSQVMYGGQDVTIVHKNADGSYKIRDKTDHTETNYVKVSELTVKGFEGHQAANDSYMAESTVSVSGWLVAAGFSGVAGVALLAVSGQQTRATSVPV
jgi:hypothetical protein